MSHLLMIESWVGGTARLLPEAIVAAGHRYTFVTRRPEHYEDRAGQRHPVLDHADRVLTLETNDSAALIAELARHHAGDRFDGTLTICDYYLETVVAVAAALAIPHPFPAAVGRERRKHLVRRALDVAGVPNPRHAVTSSWDATCSAASAIGFPVILKPCDLASSAHVRLVRDHQDLADGFAALQALGRNFRDQPRDPLYLLEEYLEGDEFSIETCTVNGVTTVLGVTDKTVTGAPYFIEDGHMFPAALAPDELLPLEALARQVLSAVDHDRGVAHIEVKRTPAGPRLVEINPRLPGNYIVELVRRVTGVDLITVSIDLALGRSPALAGAQGSVRSAAIKFVVPPHGGTLHAIRGAEQLADDPRVVRWQLDAVAGATVGQPVDNACYLGHVITVDHDGLAARAHAEAAVRGLEVVLAG